MDLRIYTDVKLLTGQLRPETRVMRNFSAVDFSNFSSFEKNFRKARKLLEKNELSLRSKGSWMELASR